MAKYSEIVALLEWADRKTAVQKTPKGRSFGKSKKIKSFDLVELLRQKKEETEALERFLEDQAKLKKKDEKKEEKKATIRILVGLEWYIIGVLSYPLIGYLQTLPVLK